MKFRLIIVFFCDIYGYFFYNIYVLLKSIIFFKNYIFKLIRYMGKIKLGRNYVKLKY